jgi:hypothetical protein
MVPAEALSMATGAILQWQDESSLTLSKNGVTLILSEGSPEMQRMLGSVTGSGAVPLTVAPLRHNGVLYLPVRAVCDGLGIQIQWNEPGRQVEVSFDNLRDGMTPQEVLLKSSQAIQNMNTYEISGENIMVMDIDGEVVNARSKSTSFVQTAPFEVYALQSITLESDSLGVAATVETGTYMTESDLAHVYVKQGSEEWIKMPMPMDPEAFQNQLRASADPEAAMAQMRQFGAAYAFADDTVKDGQEYYAINVSIDREMMQGVMDSMTALLGSAPSDVQALLKQMDLDMSYTVLINKATWIQESLTMDMNLRMQIDERTLRMRTSNQSFVTPLDSFTAPVVSGALEMTEALSAPAA